MKEDITEGTRNDIEWQEYVIYPRRVLLSAMRLLHVQHYKG